MATEKSLKGIVKSTLKNTAMFYPVYSGIATIVEKDTTFVENLTSVTTLATLVAYSATLFALEGASSLYNNYKKKQLSA